MVLCLRLQEQCPGTQYHAWAFWVYPNVLLHATAAEPFRNVQWCLYMSYPENSIEQRRYLFTGTQNLHQKHASSFWQGLTAGLRHTPHVHLSLAESIFVIGNVSLSFKGPVQASHLLLTDVSNCSPNSKSALLEQN